MPRLAATGGRATCCKATSGAAYSGALLTGPVGRIFSKRGEKRWGWAGVIRSSSASGGETSCFSSWITRTVLCSCSWAEAETEQRSSKVAARYKAAANRAVIARVMYRVIPSDVAAGEGLIEG